MGKNRAALTMVGTEGDWKPGVGFGVVNGGARGLGGGGAGYGQDIIYEHLFNMSRGKGSGRPLGPPGELWNGASAADADAGGN